MQFGPGLRGAVMRDIARSRAKAGGLKAYLGSGNLIPISPLGSQGFTFEIRDLDVFQEFAAGEFERFALASLESFYRSREAGTDLSFIGWRLLESYYASFFAAHALMRALGGGVSHVGPNEIQRLSDLANIYGIAAFALPSGSITFETTDHSGVWQFAARQSTKGSGVHDGFWRDFCSFLQTNAQTAVAAGAPDSVDYLAASIELCDAISTAGAGTASWLASVRNSINYRQEHSVWFPYHSSTSVTFREKVEGDGGEGVLRLDLSKSKDTLQLFENANSKMVHILWDVAEFFAGISKKAGHFGSRYSRMMAIKH